MLVAVGLDSVAVKGLLLATRLLLLLHELDVALVFAQTLTRLLLGLAGRA